MSCRKVLDRRPQVIGRWTRKKIISAALSAARFLSRPIILFRERTKIRQIERSVQAVVQLSYRCRREGYKDTFVVANAALYVLLSELDIAAVKLDALTHPNLWKRKHAVRSFVLIVFERSIADVFNKDFYVRLRRIKVDEKDIRALQVSVRDFRKVNDKIRTQFKDVRNETIAHRDRDALKVYDMISNLQVEDFFRSVAELYPALEEIIGLLAHILSRHGNFEASLKFRATLRNQA